MRVLYQNDAFMAPVRSVTVSAAAAVASHAAKSLTATLTESGVTVAKAAATQQNGQVTSFSILDESYNIAASLDTPASLTKLSAIGSRIT